MTNRPPHDALPPPGCPAHAARQSGYPAHPTGSGATPLYGADFARDPGSVYDRLRQQGPLAPVELGPGVDATLVTGYDAALQVLRGTETFGKDARRWRALADGRVSPDNPVVPMMTWRPNALYADGDRHRRLRGAIDDSLARIDPNALRGYVERSADAIIDRIGPTGQADLLADYARMLPQLVMNQIFGCPPDLGDRLAEGMGGIFDGVDAEKADALLTETLITLVQEKRQRPAADLTSWLMAHEARLTDEEMIHQLVVLMGAGNEPMHNLIANALRLLFADDRFAGNLGGGGLPVEDALDEVLWTDPPMANYGVHYPFYDTEVAGYRLHEGEPVVISFAAATTDPTLASDQRSGNRAHLAWSAGPHSCPARREARIIAAVAMERLLDRLPDIELAVRAEELQWRPGPFQRALTGLPVRFPPVAAPLPPPAPPVAQPGYGPIPAAAPAAVSASPSALPDETPGDSRWTASPTSSTRPAATSPERQPGSRGAARRRGWSSLARWWRGR
ncbi:cytochrome P450 [Streptantibioticus ferralitis]|uniref:cytochrome P450 n=1 Tax=Streptantibioticus ferralitis TaxID=236510 RepID=UPI00336FDD1B